jgi:hypothetical protein
MKAVTMMSLALGVLIPLGQADTHASASSQVKPETNKAVHEKAPARTLWVLSYERRDLNLLADHLFLPRFVGPALAKLKDKGAVKIRFDFKERQLLVWFKGNHCVTLKDIQAAFPILELKLIKQTTCCEDP